MDPYGPHQHCLFIVSPKVHHLGSFRPVWASKQGEIGLKSAPNALLWGLRFASDLPPIGLQMALNGPKWPPMAPELLSLSIIFMCIFLGFTVSWLLCFLNKVIQHNIKGILKLKDIHETTFVLSLDSSLFLCPYVACALYGYQDSALNRL